MSMLLLTLAAAAQGSVLRAEPCRHPGARRVEAREPVRIRPLGAMPPARQLLAVYRSVDGCPTPVVVRAEVGANGGR